MSERFSAPVTLWEMTDITIHALKSLLHKYSFHILGQQQQQRQFCFSPLLYNLLKASFDLPRGCVCLRVMHMTLLVVSKKKKKKCPSLQLQHTQHSKLFPQTWEQKDSFLCDASHFSFSFFRPEIVRLPLLSASCHVSQRPLERSSRSPKSLSG